MVDECTEGNSQAWAYNDGVHLKNIATSIFTCRYQRQVDGKWRLQTVRYESMELTTHEDTNAESLQPDMPNLSENEEREYEDMSDRSEDANHAGTGENVIDLNDVCVISIIPTVDRMSDAAVIEGEKHPDSVGLENAGQEGGGGKGNGGEAAYDTAGCGNEETEMDFEAGEELEGNTNNNAEEVENIDKRGRVRGRRSAQTVADSDKQAGKVKGTRSRRKIEANEEVMAKVPKIKSTQKRKVDSQSEHKEVTLVSEDVDPSNECVEIHIVTNSAGEYVLENAKELEKESLRISLPKEVDVEEETMYNLQMLGEVALQEHVIQK